MSYLLQHAGFSLWHMGSVVICRQALQLKCGVFLPCSMWDFSSPTRDLSHVPYIGRLRSQPLGHQGSSENVFLMAQKLGPG